MIQRGEALRWGACIVLAVSLHVAGAAVLLARWTDDNELTAGTPVILMDFAPEITSPQLIQPNRPDVVQSVRTEPEPTPPEPEKETPPPAPEPQLAMLPPPKPIEKPKEDKPKLKKSVARAVVAADQKAERAAAPQQGANGQAAVQNWLSQLYAAIQRQKRAIIDLPAGTTASLAISIDRSGGVHNPHIVRSSGSPAFDQEALAMVARAAPLPPPPPEKPGDRISVMVPLHNSFR